MKKQKFRKLSVWEKAMNFIEDIYKSTDKFPSKEIYTLTSQLRRAALSIAMNIAEGSGSDSDKEFNRYLNISLKSSYEVICGIEIANRLQYLSEKESNVLTEKCEELSAMLTGLRKSLLR